MMIKQKAFVMYQLTPEEKAKIDAMYLGCNVYDEFDSDVKTLWRVAADGFIQLKKNAIHTRLPTEFKLLLTPLDKITDEDAVEIYYLWNGQNSEGQDPASYGRDVIALWNHNLPYKLYQYLISKGYAVPLFFLPAMRGMGRPLLN